MRRQHGFTLLEIVLILAIYFFVFLLAARLLQTTLGLTHRVDTLQADQIRWSIAQDRLHADVWRARAIAVADEATVTVSQSGGIDVTWRIRDDPEEPALERTVATGEETQTIRIRSGVPGLRWSREGAALVVHLPGQGDTPGQRVFLMSQLGLAGAE